jgi:acetyl-CoA carboxylase biotin carboxyl carrier protein
MPEPHRTSDRTAAERQADHAGLARLSDTLVPELVKKLSGSGLGELEVHEGDWTIRLRRPVGAVPHARRERPRPAAPAARLTAPVAAEPADPRRATATSPAVGLFRTVASVGHRVRTGDRLGVVDLLGIPQDVTSPIDGVLVEFLVETGEAVEFGEEVAVVAAPVVDRGGDHPAGAVGEG